MRFEGGNVVQRWICLNMMQRDKLNLQAPNNSVASCALYTKRVNVKTTCTGEAMRHCICSVKVFSVPSCLKGACTWSLWFFFSVKRVLCLGWNLYIYNNIISTITYVHTQVSYSIILSLDELPSKIQLTIHPKCNYIWWT